MEEETVDVALASAMPELESISLLKEQTMALKTFNDGKDVSTVFFFF